MFLEEFQDLPTLRSEGTTFLKDTGIFKLTAAHHNILAEQNLMREITFHIFFIYIT